MTKNAKRYLMLIAAVGLVAIAAGGSGTFATFNATVSNNGNTFASGTLYLHDTNGSTTCASESSATNTNIGAAVSLSSPTLHDTSNGCATLFSNLTLPNATGKIAATHTITSSGSVSNIYVSGLSGNPIALGDEILLNDGSGDTQPFYVSGTTSTSSGVTTIPVHTQTATATFTAGTATATDDARFASITLVNAGTINASDIEVSTACDDSFNTTTGTVSSTNGTAHTITLSPPLTNGIPLGTTIKDGTATVGTLSASAAPGSTVLQFAGGPSGVSNGDTLSWAIQFTGSGTALCGSLPIAIVETADSTFNHDAATPALGCATPADTGAIALANYGCNWTTAPAISDSFLSSPDALVLASGGNGNTTALDGSNGTRHFVVGIGSPPGGLSNPSQNELATFDLTWKIAQ